MAKNIQILLADDHRLMRMGLSSLIASEKDMEVIGEAENGRIAVRLATELHPDVVIMDLMMPELSGAEATKGILANVPNAKIMILTSFGTSVEMAAAITNGAVGALMKDTATEDLVAAIRAVVEGKTVIPQQLIKAAQTLSERPKLSERQLAILASVMNGFSNADIARQFNLSEITVKKHLSSVFAKLGASNRSEAVAIALRLNLLQSDEMSRSKS